MSYNEVMLMPYGVFIGMLSSIQILQAQEQLMGFNVSAYGNPNLKQSARTKLYRDISRSADPSRFIDDHDKKEVTMRDMVEILRQAHG